MIICVYIYIHMIIFLHTLVKYGPFLDPLASTATVYRCFVQHAYVYI